MKLNDERPNTYVEYIHQSNEKSSKLKLQDHALVKKGQNAQCHLSSWPENIFSEKRNK